eukprot:scaffold3281_cov129-Cylindrotheca_fusiformis.AAC.2
MRDRSSTDDVKSTQIVLKVNSKPAVSWDASPPVLHVFHSNSEKAEDTWYLKEDLNRFLEQCELMRSSVQRDFTAGDYFSFWGLEHTMCQELWQNRSTRKQEAFDVVIDEQENQHEDCEYLPEYIAEIYKDIARISHMEAHERALRYRKELCEDAD